MNKHSCILCRKSLNRGIIINGRSICKSCEDRLVKAEAGTDLYNYYRDCIKKAIAVSVLKHEDTVYEEYK
jgi:hypothetical protein